VWYFAEHFSFSAHQVLNSIVSYEKNEELQQANLFKHQTVMFHFSTYRPNSFIHLSHLSTSFLMQKSMLAAV